MKILFISNDQTVLEEHSSARSRMREYARAMGELHIVTPAAQSDTIQDGTLHLYGVRTLRLFRVGALALRARDIIVRHEIQVVSAQDPFEQGLAALKAIKGTTAKLHIQVHTDFLSPWFVRGGNIRSPRVPVPFLNRVRRHIADQVLPNAQGIRVVSERIRSSIVARYGTRVPDPIVIPIRVSRIVPDPVSLPQRPFTFTLTTVGRLESEKRIQDSIAALALIKDTHPTVGLYIIGEGSEKSRLKQYALSSGLGERVLFSSGWRTDAWGLVRSSQAYIQTSAYEGYGRTLLEAALAGVPIITTDVGIVGEVFQGYAHVLSAPVADPAALSVHIRSLVENVALRTELSMHARDAAEAHLAHYDTSAEAMAADLARLCI